MSLTFIKGIGAGLAIVFMLLIVGSSEVSAQSRRNSERERQRAEREQRRNDRVTERRVTNSNYITGYQTGVLAGEFDRRKNKYNQSNVYRGSGPYRSAGDPTGQDYVYRQGYLEGYNDGFSGRRKY
jgi:hypothetical protein